MSDDPLLQVSTDLGCIMTLHHGLLVQAWHKANAREMPGGEAMAELGPVANLSAVERRNELDEAAWLTKHGEEICEACTAAKRKKPDDDGLPMLKFACEHRFNPWGDDVTTLTTLRFWTEDYRLENGCVIEGYTVATEAQWLIDNLDWIASTEVKFGDFERAIGGARRRLEDMLQDGERDKRGLVSCTRCLAPLVRDADPRRDCGCPAAHGPHDANSCCLRCKIDDATHAGHKQGGLADTWHCSDEDCWRTYTAEEYKTLVAQDARNNAKSLAAQELVKRFEGITVGQIRMWALREKVRKCGRDELNRMTYDVSDVARLAG